MGGAVGLPRDARWNALYAVWLEKRVLLSRLALGAEDSWISWLDGSRPEDVIVGIFAVGGGREGHSQSFGHLNVSVYRRILLLNLWFRQ